VELRNFQLKWGHFYNCSDEKRTELPLINTFRKNLTLMPTVIPVRSGESVEVCSTGAKLMPSGVEGSLNVTARVLASD
jgi:hypothetical protein